MFGERLIYDLSGGKDFAVNVSTLNSDEGQTHGT